MQMQMPGLMRTVRGRKGRVGLAGGAFLLAATSALLVMNPLGASAGAGGDPTTSKAAAAGARPASQPGVQVNGAIGHFSSQNATDTQCTTSTSFVDIPGMSVTFTIGGTARQTVLALFQGEWFNNDRALARIVVNGFVVPGPGDNLSPVAMDSGNDAGGSVDETNGFNFITNALKPGVKTLKVQWASVGGHQICVDERSLIVERK
jgi:hypothetical protein